MLAEVASFLLQKDPAQAEQLTRESLSTGIVHQFPELCRGLNEVNPGAGDKLMDAAIEHIRLREINGLELVAMGQEIFGIAGRKHGDITLNELKKVDAGLAVRFLQATVTGLKRAVEKLDASQATPIVEFSNFSPAAPKSEIAASFYTALFDLIPAFDRYDAEEASVARALLKRLAAHMNVVERNHIFIFSDDTETSEGLLVEAEATKDEKVKNELYQLAALLAGKKESFDRALSIVERITDPASRLDLHDSLLRDEIDKLVQARKVAQARQLMNQVVSPIMKAYLLFNMAQYSVLSSDPVSTSQLLDEATELLLSGQDDQIAVQAKMLMDIVSKVAASDPERAFKTARAAINLINVWATVPASTKAKNHLSADFYATDLFSLFGATPEEFEKLSRVDYFRTLKLVQSIDDPALKISAELAVIRVNLSN